MGNEVFLDFPDQNNRLLDSSVKALSNQDGCSVSERENFFNSKKKNILLLWSIIFAVTIFIVVKFLLNINFFNFFRKLSEASKVPYFLAIILAGFSSFLVCEVFIRVRVLKIKLGKKLEKVTGFEWFNFSVISFIIQSITPFSIGSEPYSIWWLNKKGISVKESSAVVAVTSVCWFIGQFLITWPSFIFITINNWSKISSRTISTTYWLVFAGLCVDICVSIFIFVISYSKKFHYLISKSVNDFKRYFGFNYSTDDEIFQRCLKDSDFQRTYIRYLLNTSTLKIIGWYLFNNLWVYLLFVSVHGCFNNSSWNLESAFNSYNLINVSTTATNFFPLPSSEGSLQKIVKELLNDIPVVQGGTSCNDETIFLWRFLYKYFGMLIGFIFVLIFGFNPKKTRFLS